MKVPFVSFKPLEKELDTDLRAAFERVYNRSWYIEGEEDEAFEEAFAKFCNQKILRRCWQWIGCFNACT